MKKLIIIGNSTAAEILLGYLKQDERYEVVAFAVDAQYIDPEYIFNLPVFDVSTLPERYPVAQGYRLLMAVGYGELNTTRAVLFKRCKAMGYEFETYIHPDAKVYNGHNIGEGSIVMANTVVEVFSEVGVNTVIWSNCVIGHHSVISEHCWVASGTVIAGESSVGEYCFLGVNVTISNQVKVASRNIIGGHTAIHKHTKENEVYLSSQGEKIRFCAQDYATHFLK